MTALDIRALRKSVSLRHSLYLWIAKAGLQGFKDVISKTEWAPKEDQ